MFCLHCASFDSYRLLRLQRLQRLLPQRRLRRNEAADLFMHFSFHLAAAHETMPITSSSSSSRGNSTFFHKHNNNCSNNKNNCCSQKCAMGAPHGTLDAFACSPDSLNCHLHLTDRRNVATKAVHSGTRDVIYE